jgi:integrase/transcriptional regulator with XRE-family HTH domain
LEKGWKKMALKQDKKIEKTIVETKTLTKQELAKKLKISIATINEYILGDKEMPDKYTITPIKNGLVKVTFYEMKEKPIHEGVFYNELKNIYQGKPDRSYYFKYTDFQGRKLDMKVGKASEGITPEYCKEMRKNFLHELRTGESGKKVIRNKRMVKEVITLDMIAEKYHKDRKLHMTAANLRDSENQYKNHIGKFEVSKKRFLGTMDITEIKKSHINDLMIFKIDKHAPKTVNIIVEKLSTIFNFAIKNQIVKNLENPTISIEKLDELNERTRFLDKSEIKLLIDTVRKDKSDLFLFTYLAITTGSRLINIINLKIKDFDMNNYQINYYDTKNKTYYKSFIKTDDEDFMKILTSRLKEKKANDFLLSRATEKANYRYIQRALSKVLDILFNEEINERYNLDNTSAKEKAELRREKVVIHTLRHTFASQLAINGTDIYRIKTLMNHKDIKQTMRYAKLAPDSGRKEIENLF